MAYKLSDITEQTEFELIEWRNKLRLAYDDRIKGRIDNTTANALARLAAQSLIAVELQLRVRSVSGVAPDGDSSLLLLIDSALFYNGENAVGWEGTAAELERALTGKNSPVRFEAQELCRYSTALGQSLGYAERENPHRIHRRLLNGRTLWKIDPPIQEEPHLCQKIA